MTDSRRRTTYKLYKKCENKKTANLPTNSVKYASLLFSGKHDFQKEKKTIQIDDNLSLEKNLEVKMTDLTITEDKKQEVEFEPERENIKSGIY